MLRLKSNAQKTYVEGPPKGLVFFEIQSLSSPLGMITLGRELGKSNPLPWNLIPTDPLILCNDVGLDSVISADTSLNCQKQVSFEGGNRRFSFLANSPRGSMPVCRSARHVTLRPSSLR